MSGHGTVETAVEATRIGAKDFIEKPLSLAKLLHTVERVLNEAVNDSSSVVPSQPLVQAVSPVGKSMQTQLLREHLDKLAHHGDRILLRGETGCGKAFCARYLHVRSHQHDSKQQDPFVDVHTCLLRDGQAAALLFGREALGSEKFGAASADVRLPLDITPGFLDQAQGGTLFLDDVAELSLEIQQSLHTALSSGQWVRVNGHSAQSLKVRIIAATRYDLSQEVRAGRFREDLYHLLNNVSVSVPALREHLEDVTDLLQHFVDHLVDKEDLPYRNFTVAAQNRLRHYDWPGNIRELESLVRRLLVFGLEADIGLDEVDAVLQASAPLTDGSMLPQFDLPLRQAREKFEKAYLEYHLQQTGGSVGKVAKLVGMERTNLYRKLRALGIVTRRTCRQE